MRLMAVSLTLGAAAILAGCSQPAQPAATASAAPAALPPATLDPNTQFVGAGVNSPPGCPTLQWDLAPTGEPGVVHGIAFFSDLSGIGYVTGSVAQNGQIQGSVKSVYGTGPEGTITGTRTSNGIQVQLAGQGCSNVTIVLPSSSARPFGSAGGRA
ncbi:MAG: hypothetical protein JO122_20490 [Acetobacteraceae bacterium]|nr:hypothetical protein [Acetobacteraceae bacterium]